MSKISYGGRSSSSGPRVFLLFAATIAAITATYYWGDLKASKMLSVYPDTPRTVKSAGPDYVSSLRAQLNRAQQQINELTRDVPPANRESKEEERERWEEQKEHLHARIAELEESIEVMKKAYSDPISEEDRAGVDTIINGGEV
jgi:peptidoglycan hydrolase CwlO-like protein